MLQTIALDGDQVVSFVSYGPDDGFPVLLFHGTPASSIGFDFAATAARTLGVRVIAPDRPGIAGSTPSASERTDVAAYAPHVERLADAFGLDRFSVVGYSGGGPYALALAAALPDRVVAAATMAGVATLDWSGADEGLEPSEVRLARWTSTKPGRARVILRGLSFAMRHFTGSIFRAAEKKMTDSDRATLARLRALDPDAAGPAFVLESFRQGIDGVFDDYRGWVEPWGFDPATIRVPTHIWQGIDDVLVPISHAHHLEHLVPTAELHALPEVSHVSLQDHIEDIIRSVVP